MLYLSKFLNSSIFDKEGELVGRVDDLAVNAKEVFPSIVALSFKAEDDTEHMLRWADNVDSFDFDTEDDKGSGITLKTKLDELEYTHLEEGELFLERDLLNKQIVDVKEKKVARVSDLKFSADGSDLRLLGAECGLYGRLHFMTGLKASITRAWASTTGKALTEDLIAWNYIDIPGRDMSQLELSVSHQRLTQLRPADIADIIEQLDPKLRRTVFAYLDRENAADTVSELEDEYRTELIGSLDEIRAVNLLGKMAPDDVTDILSALEYEKAEKMLQLMGIEDAEVIRTLMEYRKNSAGGIMTPTVAVATEEMTVKDTTDYLRQFVADTDDLHYVYIVDGADEEGAPIANSRLLGVVTLLELLLQDDDKKLGEIAHYNVVSTSPDEDQEVAAELIAKHNLLALPVIDKDGHLLGTITVDDVVDIKARSEDDKQVTADGQESTTPALINSGTVGDEVKGIFCKIGDGLRWVIPQGLSWFVIWFALVLLAAIAQINIIAHMHTLEDWPPDSLQVFSFAVGTIQLSALILPLILIAICASIKRSVELLTSKGYLAPSTFVRYASAIVIAIGHTFVSYVIFVAILAGLNVGAGFDEPSFGSLLSGFAETFNEFTLLLFIPTLCALLVCALFAAWRVGVAVSKHKAGSKVHPGRIATATMLIFALVFVGVSYPTSWIQYQQMMQAQEEMMMGEDWDDWGDDELINWENDGDWDGDWDEWDGEDFGDWGDGEIIDLGDIDFGDGELDLEELLREELGEVELE